MIFPLMEELRDTGSGVGAGRGGRGDGVLIVALFFFSGAAGLIYEVLWGRMLGLQMGNTAYSLATILTVFMGGLALGSWIGGKLAHRVQNGLRVYGWMEIGIGLFCLALPHLIDALHPPMRWVYRNYYGSQALFSFMQFLLSGAVLLIPVTLMGATLPVVAEHVTRRRERLAGSIGLIYAINTVGAFVGCMVAGLWLITELGVSVTNFTAAGINLSVGAIAVLLASRAAPTVHLGDSAQAGSAAPTASGATPDGLVVGAPESPTLRPVSAEPKASIPIPLLLLGFGLSGFAAMAYQVAWTRAITLSIGSATYAFTLIVGAFILGLALGSAILGAIGEHKRLTTPVLVGTQILLVLFAWIVVYQLGEMPAWSAVTLYEHAPDGKLPADAEAAFYSIQRATFLKLFLMVLPATFVMGGTLPLVCKEISRSAPAANVGAILGRAYASNTVGTILGSFIAGFVLVPLVGKRGTIVAGMFLNSLVAALWIAYAVDWPMTIRTSVRRGVATLSAAAAVGFVVLHLIVAQGKLKPEQLQVVLPTWDEPVMTSAPYIDGHIALNNLKRMRAAQGETWSGNMQEWETYIKSRYEILEYEEDVSTTVTISYDRQSQLPELRVGGKIDARKQDSAQSILAHLPLLLHPNPEDMLIVGLGSGGTLQTALSHNSIQSVQDVEISGAVVRMSEKWFERSKAFHDPRAEIIVGDGRQHVAMTDRRYDVIVSQPSNPWIVGASSLFTKDCFEQMKERLKPGGVVCIWMQGFQVGDGPVRTLLKTFSSVFEHMDLWENTSREEYFLTGYLEPFEIDAQRIENRILDESIREELRGLYIEGAVDLLGRHIGDREQLEPFFSESSVSTDDHNLLESEIPKELLMVSSTALAKELLQYRRPASERATFDPTSDFGRAFQTQAENIYRSHPIAIEVFIGLRDLEIQRTELLPELYALNPLDLFSKIYEQQNNRDLNNITTALNGHFTNQGQAMSKPAEFSERCLLTWKIGVHGGNALESFVYCQSGPAATPHKPDEQWLWRFSLDDEGKIVVDTLDLPRPAGVPPGQPIERFISPWRPETSLKGVRPNDLIDRGCTLITRPTQEGIYAENAPPGSCSIQGNGSALHKTDFLLMNGDPNTGVPVRINLWKREVDSEGTQVGGPVSPTEYYKVSSQLPR